MIQKKDAEMRGDDITQKKKPIIISGPVLKPCTSEIHGNKR